MKFIVDEMPDYPEDCPFYTGTCSKPTCQCGPESWREHTCDFFKNGYNPDDCPHLIPLSAIKS